VLDMCERFHCLPSALLNEDAELLRLMTVEHLGRNRAEQESQARESGSSGNY
jgi:hypothetical protein